MVEDPLLDRSGTAPDRQEGITEFYALKDLMCLHDVFRMKNPRDKMCTFYSGAHQSQSRLLLDRLYSSLSLALSGTTTTRTVSLSDHKLVRVRFIVNDIMPRRGRGYFKMNTLLLSEEGVTA